MRRELWLPDFARQGMVLAIAALRPEPGSVEYVALRRVRPLLEGIAGRHGITLKTLLVTRRGRSPDSLARQESYYELRRLGFAWPECSRIMGAVSKHTAQYGAARHEKRLAKELAA
jgi:hypothetical protein